MTVRERTAKFPSAESCQWSRRPLQRGGDLLEALPHRHDLLYCTRSIVRPRRARLGAPLSAAEILYILRIEPAAVRHDWPSNGFPTNGGAVAKGAGGRMTIINCMGERFGIYRIGDDAALMPLIR